jgi:hypothetical protein
MRFFHARSGRSRVGGLPQHPRLRGHRVCVLFPAVSDRLNELRRQRALLQQHMEWLDREIAAASGNARPAPLPLQPPTPQMATSASKLSPIISVSLTETPSPQDTDALLRQYASDPKDSEASVKRGCWIAFIAAFALLGLVMAVWYFGVDARR